MGVSYISLKGPLLGVQELFSLGDLSQIPGFTHFLHIFSWVTIIFSRPNLFRGCQTLYIHVASGLICLSVLFCPTVD